MRPQTIKCAPRLPLGDTPDKRSADYRADRTERCSEVVAVVKARTSALRLKDVFRAGTRARRAASLPHGQLIRPAVDERPVNLEAHAAQVYSLIHLISDPHATIVRVPEPAVNRDPVTQTFGVHYHVPHLGRFGRYPGRGCDETHGSACGQRLEFLPLRERVFYGRVEGVQVH